MPTLVQNSLVVKVLVRHGDQFVAHTSQGTVEVCRGEARQLMASGRVARRAGLVHDHWCVEFGS